MVKLLAMILDMTGLFPKGSSTIAILNFIGDGAFFFLPVMVAASAAIKFKTNMSLAIAIAGVLVHPGFIDLMAQAAKGQPVDFFGVPVTAVKYTYTVIPALCMTGYSRISKDGWIKSPRLSLKLPQADADRPVRRADRHPADWADRHLDRQRHLGGGLYHPPLSRLALRRHHGRALAAAGHDRYAPRLHADHHSNHR